MSRLSLMLTCLILLRYFERILISEFVGPKLSLIIIGLISVLLNLLGNLVTFIFFITEKGWFTGQLVLKVIS